MSTKVIVGLLLTAFTLSLVPLALIARSRSQTSPNRAYHLVLDMDKQQRFNTQSKNPMFADGRAMRPQIEGTLAIEDFHLPNEVLTVADGAPRMVGNTHEPITFANAEEFAAIVHGRIRKPGTTDEAYKKDLPPGAPTGKKDAAGNDEKVADKPFYVAEIPAKILRTGSKDNAQFLADFMERGRERYMINCLPCHGATGYGDGMVQRRAAQIPIERNDPTKGINGADYVAKWTPPANITGDNIRKQTDGKIYNTITNGQNAMPAHDKQISVQDRWAIVMYVRALQLSQGQPDAATKTAAADEK
jgi:mono/diheme cytochrome c family protein